MKFDIVIFLFLLILTGCVSREDFPDEDELNSTVSSITINTKTRDASPETAFLEPGEAEAIIITKNDFNESTKLYISQLGTSQSPNFTNLDQEAPYLYIYDYKANPDANWDNEYNFVTNPERKPIDWKDVTNLGSVGNTFSFYAMYCPGSQDVRFNVERDQTGGDGDPYSFDRFKLSDIMGAYHATSSLYTRMRFRLFHLMVYLKITVYVPVLESTEIDYSGFDEDALKNAYILNAYNSFTIDWRANKSSDNEAPLAQGAGSKVKSIRMYKHKPDFTTFSLNNINDFYPQGKENTDSVRAYNFSVLFPAGQDFNNNFLCLELEAIDHQRKYYYFSGSQANNSTGEFSLTQGTLQQLYLYLPRKTNETILVKAKILPWYESSTEMTVTKKEGNGKN